MDLAYTIQKSAKRRTLTVTVERDRRVIVHAPVGAADETIHRVVESRRQWIFEKIRHPQKYHDLPHAPGKELVSGESALYLGRHYRIEVVHTGSSQVRFAQRFFIPVTPGEQRAEALRAWYMGKATDKIPPRVPRHARDRGVDVAAVKIVDSRYRWGSCTPKGNVTVNWRLIKAPMFVIDYVIVHELAHLIEANHTARFWNIVCTQAPLMDKAKTWLKEHGALLEQAI
jgi:predicted metal-dependent hydrolase